MSAAGICVLDTGSEFVVTVGTVATAGVVVMFGGVFTVTTTLGFGTMDTGGVTTVV